jgi:hypothetical protein
MNFVGIAFVLHTYYLGAFMVEIVAYTIVLVLVANFLSSWSRLKN